MRLSRWGNSLAIRLPVAVVEVLDLKEGADIEVQVAGPRSLKIEKKPTDKELLARLRKYRGMLPGTSSGIASKRINARKRGFLDTNVSLYLFGEGTRTAESAGITAASRHPSSRSA